MGSLEDGCNALLIERFTPYVPNTKAAQEDFFSPDLSALPKEKCRYYTSEVNKLQRVIVHKSPISPMGHLKFALEVGLRTEETGKFFDALHDAFGHPESKKLLDKLVEVYEFRNKYIAHYEKEIVAKDPAKSQLRNWISLLVDVQRIRSRDAVLMRYRELVERKHVSGELERDDAFELTRLQIELDQYDESFYRPILERLKTIARRTDS